jgi:hypothetical protein
MNAASPPDYLKTFAAVEEMLRQRVGHRLFTVSRVLPEEDSAERIYTSWPEAYPVHGKTPRDRTEWTALLERGEYFVANRPEDFGPHFSNLSAIVQKGLGAIINIPVLDGKRMLGNLNLLDVAGAYTGPVLDTCREAATLAASGFAQYEQWLARRGD